MMDVDVDWGGVILGGGQEGGEGGGDFPGGVLGEFG